MAIIGILNHLYGLTAASSGESNTSRASTAAAVDSTAAATARGLCARVLCTGISISSPRCWI